MQQEQYILKKGTKLKSPEREYTIEEKLGAGGFGITYRVSAFIMVGNVKIKTSFAVKEFFMSDSCERDSNNSVCYSNPVKNKVEEGRRDFLAEAKRLNKLSVSHPNIVHVNEVFEANNTVYYVMEYLDGGSLRTKVKQNGALNEQEALNMILPVIKAVDFLHQAKLTHLDIKPDNIMLRKDEETRKMVPVLIDFGLAKHYDDKGNATSTIRTVGLSDGYAPMEQYIGITTFTPQADVYALGATLLYLLTGKKPKIAGEITEREILAGLPNEVSDRTRQAIVHAMKEKKGQRTQSASQLYDSLTKNEVIINEYSHKTKTDGNGTKTFKKEEKGKKAVEEVIIEKGWLNRHGTMLGWVLAIIIAIVFFAMGANSSEDNENQTAQTEQKDTTASKTVSEIPIYGADGTVAYKYAGQVDGNNLPHGKGTATYDDGRIYVGQFEHGVRQGEATFTFSDGNVFRGTFKNDKLCNGRLTSHQKDTKGMYFEGTFNNDQPYTGSWNLANGTVYVKMVNGK